MHPDFESNLITHIFRRFGVSRITGSAVIFAFVRGIWGVSDRFKHNACLSTRLCYSWYCLFIVDANPNWNKIFYLLINALNHHYVIDDVIRAGHPLLEK